MQKKLSYGGLGCALCVILLAMSSYLPTLKAATLFAASIIPYVVYRVSDAKTAFAMYGATSVLAFLICQPGSPAVTAAFIVCFGNYPVFKGIIDKKRATVRNVLKTVLYTMYFTAIYLIFTRVLLVPVPYPIIGLFAIGLAVFCLYDYLIAQTGTYLVYRLNNYNNT